MGLELNGGQIGEVGFIMKVVMNSESVGRDREKRLVDLDISESSRKSHKNVQVHNKSKDLVVGNGSECNGESSSMFVKLHGS